MRPEEQQAAESLRDWLGNRGLRAEVRDGADPPDAHFTINGQSWAVEMTQLFAYVDWDGEEKNTANLNAAVDGLAARLRRHIPTESPMGYILEVAGPFPFGILDTIEQRATAFIQSGRSGEECLDLQEWLAQELENTPAGTRDDPATMEILETLARRRTRFTILTCDESGLATLSGFDLAAALPDGHGMAGDINARLFYSLNRALQRKARVLQAVEGHERRLLVLIQNDDFAEPEPLRQIIGEYHMAGAVIDAVFLVDSAHNAHLLVDNSNLFPQNV